MRILRNFCTVILLISIVHCFASCNDKPVSEIKEGRWKAVLIRKDKIEIPFVFDVKFREGKTIIEILNAEERLVVDQIEVLNDSIKITMPFYDSEFMFSCKGDSMIGYWTKNNETYKITIPVKAYFNEQERFDLNIKNANSNFVGSWNATFVNEITTDTSTAIAEIRMVDNKIYGTFLSTTGDYRYLEGTADERKIYLSSFDGSHVYLFVAEIANNNTELVNGIFYSGFESKQKWFAKYDQYAKLPDADNLTFLKDGFDEIDFSFKNIEGKTISLKEAKYKNKVVLVQIMGSWCPNCIDETNYLVPFYNDNKTNGLEVIGLSYERSNDFNVAANNVLKLKQRLNIPYELLIAGTNKKGGVNESLPMLENFIAFPTMIIIDKKGKVRKIHTGYSGPATGKHYVEFKAEFETFVKQLLSEK